MKSILTLSVCIAVNILGHAQPKDEIRAHVQYFVALLNDHQKSQACFSMEDAERYHWNFVPADRKGISLKELSANQQQAFMAILRAALSDEGYKKASSIMQLEVILKALENRGSTDDYRDPGKYFFCLFGTPLSTSTWGWRIEGHHVAFNFLHTKEGMAVTPYFMGSNPAIVPSGLEKGKQILKPESEKAFQLLQSLDDAQQKIAVFSGEVLPGIITGNDRNVKASPPQGINYDKLSPQQQKLFRELIAVYLMNYTKEIADRLMKSIEASGFGQFYFAWAGSHHWGKGHYYRLQGNDLWIEYDNTQNNANHVHTVVRSISGDFGEDLLKNHYKEHHHN
jgi:hypothetical protein